MIKVRIEAAKLLKEYFDIDPEVAYKMFDNGFLNETRCRNALIQLEYKEKAKPKERNRLKERLADKYCVSFASVEKILCTRN